MGILKVNITHLVTVVLVNGIATVLLAVTQEGQRYAGTSVGALELIRLTLHLTIAKIGEIFPIIYGKYLLVVTRSFFDI